MNFVRSYVCKTVVSVSLQVFVEAQDNWSCGINMCLFLLGITWTWKSGWDMVVAYLHTPSFLIQIKFCPTIEVKIEKKWFI